MKRPKTLAQKQSHQRRLDRQREKREILKQKETYKKLTPMGLAQAVSLTNNKKGVGKSKYTYIDMNLKIRIKGSTTGTYCYLSRLGPTIQSLAFGSSSGMVVLDVEEVKSNIKVRTELEDNPNWEDTNVR